MNAAGILGRDHSRPLPRTRHGADALKHRRRSFHPHLPRGDRHHHRVGRLDQPGRHGPVRRIADFGAVGWAIGMAVTWSVAIACISYGFGTLKLPVAIVAPLTNANAMVAVAIGALAFGE
jgi:hypothetical protein